MNCTKEITITGYAVKYADLREPKPRTIHERFTPWIRTAWTLWPSWG